MKILEVTESTCQFIETDEKDYNRYTRHGSESWFITMGESDEPLYDDEKERELEELFQQWKHNKL